MVERMRNEMMALGTSNLWNWESRHVLKKLKHNCEPDPRLTLILTAFRFEQR